MRRQSQAGGPGPPRSFLPPRPALRCDAKSPG
jgi:hypothetical protein